MLNSHIGQAPTAGEWTAASVRTTRMWDRGDEPNAYHAAQLVTIDLITGAQRFHRPHTLCSLTDAFSKFRSDRNAQFREPGAGRGGGLIVRGWRQTKWANREWRPMVSFRWRHDALQSRAGGGGGGAEAHCAAPPSLFLAGSAPGIGRNGSPHVAGGGGETTTVGRLKAAVRGAVRDVLTPKALPRLEESLANMTVYIEHPAPAETSRWGPNVWVLFPTYHGEREKFNGFCEDAHPGCECTGRVGECSARLCRGKKLCKVLPAGGTAPFVEHARALAAALSARGELSGGRLESVVPSVFYDDCWAGRGRCQGRRPCLEPGDHMLSCRATAMMCATEPWPAVLQKAKAWIPPAHASASFLYIYDGPSQDLFDETFRTWSPASVGFGSDVVMFGPQFASAKPRLLNTSLGLVTSAVRRADECANGKGWGGGSRGGTPSSLKAGTTTRLIFRSPAFNIDPVNSFRQQQSFARRVRPMVEALGVTFLDVYTATRDAVLQHTPHAVRFDHFSAFHFHDAGRYIQAQLFLHAMRLLA